MINRDVKITRPVKVELKASDLEEGALFILKEDLNKDNVSLLSSIRCAVCLFEGGDYDVRTTFPFHPAKHDLGTYDLLAYVDNDATVYPVEIVASELRIVT